MKVMAKSLVLVLLMAVICSSTYVAVTAAEDFPDDEQMTAYSAASMFQNNQAGTVLRGESLGPSDLENAPALRVSLNEIDLEPGEDEDNEDDSDANANDVMQTPYSAPPDTGIADYGIQIAAAFSMLAGSCLLAKRKEGSQ